MSKINSSFVCQQCGYETGKWLGKCPECGEWNSLVETVKLGKKKTSGGGLVNTKPLKLSDISSKSTARISTKTFELDRVLGGGIVPGQVTLIAGEPGIGKCVAAGTLIPTEYGLEAIENLQPNGAQMGFTKHRVNIQSINGNEPTSQFYKSGLQPTKKIETRMGYGLQATHEHPILTLSSAGKKEWKTISSIKTGDYIAVQRHGQIWGKNVTLPRFEFEIKTNAIVPNFPKAINEEMSYCLGLLIGDGGLTDFGHVNLTTKDPLITETFEKWIQSLGLTVYHLPKGLRLTVNNRIFHLWLQSIGIQAALSINKSVPNLILKSPKEIAKSFLQGLFDTDGTAGTNSKGSMPGVVEFCSASKELAQQVHLLLLQFGIIGKLRFRKNQKHGAWIIGLLGNNARLFYENIGFRLSRKQTAGKLLSDKSNNNLDVIPYLPSVDPFLLPHEYRWDRRYLKGSRAPSYEKLKFISKFVPELKSLVEPKFYWDEVRSINNAGVVECFDLCVPKSHSFVANGIVSHNSTILLQVADKLSTNGGQILYVSGEESTSQIKIRADRLFVKSKNITLMESTDIDSILNTLNGPVKEALGAVIVDSIQTMATSDLSGMAGSVGQVRECAFRLVRFAKENNIPVFIVGHVTKEGTVAGPSVLMHIVDTVLWFEGDKNTQARLIRAVKNRFGPTDEVGIFEMNDKGLVSIESPEKAFLTLNKKMVPGSVTAQVLQGTRPILVEVQSLVVSSKLPFPKRVTQGVDSKRVEMLLAILIRRAGIPLYDYDCFVNIAGGINLRGDPSVDLAICLSLASAFFDKALPGSLLAVGEVGLLGDIRIVTSQEKRLKEAKRLGYKEIVSSEQIEYLSEGIKKYLR